MDQQAKEPEVDARKLLSSHGPEARLIAAREAHKAIHAQDLTECAYWRDVMDELEMIFAQTQPRQ